MKIKIKIILVMSLLMGVLPLASFASQQVQPGGVSSADSLVFPQQQVADVGGEPAQISVKLLDAKSEPISSHLVRLISSDPNDKIAASASFTDQNGEIYFEVFSGQRGVNDYAIYDVTADLILPQRVKVAYFDDDDYVVAKKKPDILFAASGNSSGTIDHFKFEQLPEAIYPNEEISLTVVAYDSEDQIVIDYLGKVRFSTESENANFAVLPQDYNFTHEDQGKHTFSLAFSFKQIGDFKLKVTDIKNKEITGSGEFQVIARTSAETKKQNDGVKISSPVAGIYSSNLVLVNGIARPGSSLKIFDNNVVIGIAKADLEGNFAFTTPLLTDGKHKIYAGIVNEAATVVAASEVVELTIDISATEISKIVLEPAEEVKPGSAVKVKIFVKDELEKAVLMIDGNIYEMEKNDNGSYETAFKAPIEFKEYSLDFLLVDELGNESKIEGKEKIKVGGLLLNAVKPANVTGLKADGAENSVNLNWDPINDLDIVISHYRVYYGTSPNQLTEAIDTLDAKTSWMIGNLQNGTEYFFAVVAVDDKWNSSEQFSNIVSALPKPQKPGIVTGVIAAPSVNRVTLNWVAAKASAYPIKNYRIFYGNNPKSLTSSVDTFNAEGTWYIANLAPGVPHYFSVVAVDEKGNMSEQLSEFVLSIPLAPAPVEINEGLAGESAIKEMKKDPSEAGPEVLWLIWVALFGGHFYARFRRR